VQFTKANANESVQVGNDSTGGVGLKWQAPPHGVFKANWDIAISTDRKCMGIGIIIRDTKVAG
jgi:hypothetical protein